MKMPFPDNTFDAAYAIEATCHAADAAECYREILRVLKPGQLFAAYEWCLTNSFNPHNEEHKKIKALIEIGSGLPDIRTTEQCLEGLVKAGYEVIWSKDMAGDSPVPWYSPIDTSHFSLGNFRRSAIGISLIRTIVRVLESVRLAPKGSLKVHEVLEMGGESLTAGGRKGIFTPMFFFLARKPHSNT
uniref:Methyltransferase n=1 Tax=Rhizophora mucronata TaxID=61149 RepID=A0A2P2PQD1_RHIMU